MKTITELLAGFLRWETQNWQVNPMVNGEKWALQQFAKYCDQAIQNAAKGSADADEFAGSMPAIKLDSE